MATTEPTQSSRSRLQPNSAAKESGQSPTAKTPRVTRRGIVVTHGVGSQRRVDQLDDVVEPMVEFLGRALGSENVSVMARTQVSDDLTASAQIHLSLPNGDSEEWHVREAWWADSFRPSASGAVLAWAIRAARFHVDATTRYVFWRHLEKLAGKVPKTGGEGIWGGPSLGGARQVLDPIVWLVITLGYLGVYLVGAAVILPLYVFLLLPFWVLFPAGIGRVQQGLVNVLTGGIGDQHATTNRHVAVAGAADTVVNALWYFLAPNRPDNLSYDTVTLIAHSGGCVVSYVALARRDIQQWLSDPKSPRRMTWITVGSGLNLAYRMQGEKKARDKIFWSRNLRDTVNWIDIYARYDPVPQGPAPEGMVRAIMGEGKQPYVSLRIANHDLPFTDHGAYWGNHEEVMSRIVHAVSDSRLGSDLLDADDPKFARQYDGRGMTQEHPLTPGIARAIAGSRQRRDRVTRNRFLSIVALAAGLALLIWWGPAAGAWLLGESPGPLTWGWLTNLRHAAGAYVPSGVGPLSWSEHRPRIAGMIVLLALLYALLLLGRLAGQLRAWKESDPSYETP